MKIFKVILSLALIIIFYLLIIPSKIQAFIDVVAGTSQSQLVSDQSTYPTCTTDSYTLPFNTCWNNATPGQSDCGQGCTYQGQIWGNSWTRYTYDPATYGTQYFQTSFAGCQLDFVEVGNACSTADKYNGSPAYPGGDTTELRAGFCDCSTGGIYKTCCSNGSPSQSVIIDGNPNQPDAGCGGATAVQCGGAGQLPCGPAACATATPTPTPTPTSTGCTGAPTYSPPQNQPTTVPASGFCDPTATSCQAPCSTTCTDHSGRTCPATSCVSVWGCQGGTQWYNSGTYYSSCPTSCNAAQCVGNSTQTLCGNACLR